MVYLFYHYGGANVKAYIEVIKFSSDIVTASGSGGCATYSCPTDMGSICIAND